MNRAPGAEHFSSYDYPLNPLRRAPRVESAEKIFSTMSNPHKETLKQRQRRRERERERERERGREGGRAACIGSYRQPDFVFRSRTATYLRRAETNSGPEDARARPVRATCAVIARTGSTFGATSNG